MRSTGSSPATLAASARTAAGVYSVGLTLSEVLRGIPETVQALVFSQATRPALAQYSARAARHGFLLTAGVGLVLTLASGPLLPLVFGEPYREASTVFAWLFPGVIGLALSYALSPLLTLEGRVTINTMAALLGLATLWGFMLAGPGALSLTKAALASSLAYWVVAAVQIAYIVGTGRLRGEQLVPRAADVRELVREGTALGTLRAPRLG